MTRTDSAYDFSVIIAIFNTAAYLGEAIESVVDQTIGFEDHIQLILVDDGSTDDSALICKSYQHRYPDNIIVIEQENKGAAAARNAGLDVTQGAYVNFLDSDDKWDPTAFERAASFFSLHPDVQLASTRYNYFGAREGDHQLNYKFKKTRVIDLRKTYDCPQLSASTSFISRAAIGNLRFNENLPVSEDFRFVNTILLRTLEYGVLSEPVYWYRIRQEHDSAINTMRENKKWYTVVPAECYKWLFDACTQLYGSVLPFLQYAIMYDLQWRLKSARTALLSPAEEQEYRGMICWLLRHIDDHIISEQRSISIDYVSYALCLKYGMSMQQLLSRLSVEEGELCCRTPENEKIVLRPIEKISNRLVIDEIRYEKGSFALEGYLKAFRFRIEDLDLRCYVNNQRIPVRLYGRPDTKMKIPFSDETSEKTGFHVEFFVGEKEQASFRAEVTYLGSYSRPLVCQFTKNVPLNNKARSLTYALLGDALIRPGVSGALLVSRLGISQDERERLDRGNREDAGSGA